MPRKSLHVVRKMITAAPRVDEMAETSRALSELLYLFWFLRHSRETSDTAPATTHFRMKLALIFLQQFAARMNYPFSLTRAFS